MNLLGRKKDNRRPSDPSNEDTAGDTAEDVGEDTAATQAVKGSRVTPPKGRPTPRRNQAARRRGPVAPAPMTAAEARRRRKEMRTKLTREERKAERLERRADMAERREKMMAGDEAYLLPRDKGPVRRYVRDVVDARRNVLGLFMPSALMLIFVMLAVPSVQLQRLLSPAMLLLVVIMVIDGFVLGRKVNRLVDAKFPDNVETGWRLGFYAASRASQLRRMRAPRPMVNRGEKIA
ncbi:DUF3043 domain-containing protein [Mycolicibacterium sp. XJ1819]